MKKRISFDFDETLDRADVFRIAQQISKHVEIWIVTSRCTEEEFKKINLYYNNNDLYDVANKLNIPNERIVFTNLTSKSTFFNKTNLKFVAHLDNDDIELLDIDDLDKDIITINVCQKDWNKKLLSLI
jgi:hypothetical protein